MKQLLRELGIKMGMPGTGIMEQIMNGEKSANDLTKKEVKLILEAWETRHCAPFNQKEYLDKVSGLISEEEVAAGMYSQDEQSLADAICRYLTVIM